MKELRLPENHNADLLLAVGGGSVCDYSKGGVCISELHGRSVGVKVFLCGFDEP